MKKIIYLIFLFAFLINYPVYSAQIIPPEARWGKIKQIVKEINGDGITLDYRCKDEDYVERNGRDNCDVIESLNISTGYFLFQDRFNEFNRFHVADINNDGQEDYILQMKSGSGEFFDIDVIITKNEGKYVDIFKDIRATLVKSINPECDKWGCDELDMYHGDLVIEKREDGKIYFSLVGPSGSWYDMDDNFKTVKVEKHNPTFYTFLWDADGLKQISVEPRQYTKKTDYDSQIIQEVDKWLLEGGITEVMKDIELKKDQQ